MKLLMLHGYSQNRDTHRRKLRKLEERLRNQFLGVELHWLEGPLKLHASDVPGYESTCVELNGSPGPELRAWFYLRYVQDPPHGLCQSLDLLAEVLNRDGPFDGVVAFSQGTVIAAMVASLLQGKVRFEAHEKALRISAHIMPYPEAFLKVQHPPLKFGILYAGRVGRTSYYDWLYQSPPIDTPFCHFVGLWDPMVDHEERDAVLAKLSSNSLSTTIIHGGGHFVPTDDDNNDRVVDFISNTTAAAKIEDLHTSSSSKNAREVPGNNDGHASRHAIKAMQ